ncbi:hypothetical protein [Rhizobium leguminosarum]|uniref:hypothetical protein n=1 Tax=Rhizobium leguminosarum TaxID=384 RepID=UPI00144119A0|nr:hypothetical protein [Rhizobium leguminosarum]MBX4858764.1 hypothetical protein [Rhizobium bangladeshense]MBY5869323.1 hypothetical protein [Rhizobium leguminosarum]NKM08389.1 hypothetical protein [Rhizobium leguminosarum bv. viciae]
MPKIDINRLRRFHADASAAHAALRAQWEKLRYAREDLARARTQLEAARRPVPGVKTVEDGKAQKRFAAAVTAAEESLRLAEAELERLQRVWDHAARLRDRVRQFASEQGELPKDLQEI